MTEPTSSDPNQEPAPGAPGEEPAGRDLGATISALAEDISERVNVFVDKATPVVRDAAARASELVAKAGEAAGPAAHRAAEATETLGGRVAAKGRDIAADLRRSNAGTDAPADAPAPTSAGPAADAAPSPTSAPAADDAPGQGIRPRPDRVEPRARRSGWVRRAPCSMQIDKRLDLPRLAVD